ncbi:MAG: XrtA/PEP-CTERM system exopolysaccharide export protein, partial [Steroidobacteraceae bacterium]
VLDVVIQAGALGPYASLNHARIVRKEPNGKETDIRVKLGDLLNKGDARQNRDMCPGDVLVIPQTMF